jgi:hypothetical protein
VIRKAVDDGVRTLITENRMLRKGPTLAKAGKNGAPKFKIKAQLQRERVLLRLKANFKGKEGQADCWEERGRCSETSESLPDFTS